MLNLPFDNICVKEAEEREQESFTEKREGHEVKSAARDRDILRG